MYLWLGKRVLLLTGIPYYMTRKEVRAMLSKGGYCYGILIQIRHYDAYTLEILLKKKKFKGALSALFFLLPAIFRQT